MKWWSKKPYSNLDQSFIISCSCLVGNAMDPLWVYKREQQHDFISSWYLPDEERQFSKLGLGFWTMFSPWTLFVLSITFLISKKERLRLSYSFPGPTDIPLSKASLINFHQTVNDLFFIPGGIIGLRQPPPNIPPLWFRIWFRVELYSDGKLKVINVSNRALLVDSLHHLVILDAIIIIYC